MRGQEEIFIEVTLIDGVNDSLEDAKALLEFLRPFQESTDKDGGVNVKVNLISYNETGSNGWKPSKEEAIMAFRDYLREHWQKLFVSVRMPRGREESSACGQLATEVVDRKKR